MSRRTKGSSDTLTIVTNKVCAKIRLDDIELIEQVGRKLHIFTDQEEFVCYDNLESLAPILVNRSFFRSRKGLIINFLQVARLEQQEIYFESGRVYCMGRNNYIKTKNAFKNYLLGYPPFVFSGVAVGVAENDDNDNYTA